MYWFLCIIHVPEEDRKWSILLGPSAGYSQVADSEFQPRPESRRTGGCPTYVEWCRELVWLAVACPLSLCWRLAWSGWGLGSPQWSLETEGKIFCWPIICSNGDFYREYYKLSTANLIHIFLHTWWYYNAEFIQKYKDFVALPLEIYY